MDRMHIASEMVLDAMFPAKSADTRHGEAGRRDLPCHPLPLNTGGYEA